MGTLNKTTRYTRHTFGDNGLMGNKQVVSVSFASTDLGKPSNASTTALLAATAVSSTGATTLTPTAQPAVARNLTVTVAAGTAADIAAGNITVTGTNSEGATITETFAVTADTAGTLTGNKAFKSVTSASVPQQDGASVTVAIGTGAKFGTGFRTLASGAIIKVQVGFGSTRTLENASANAVSASAVESNTITPTTTPDGATQMRVYVLNPTWHVEPTNDNPSYGV